MLKGQSHRSKFTITGGKYRQSGRCDLERGFLVDVCCHWSIVEGDRTAVETGDEYDVCGYYARSESVEKDD